MDEPLKYYFVLPRLTRPVGGANVIFWLIETLKDAGFDAAPLYPEARFQYAYYPYAGQSFYNPSLFYPLMPKSRSRLTEMRYILAKPRSKHRNIRWRPSKRDVFVLPEFIYPQCMRILPKSPCILATQSIFGLANAYMKDQSSGAPEHHNIKTGFATSDATHTATTTLINAPSHRMQLPVCTPDLSYQKDKKLQIAYMPRKRSAESAMVLALLKELPDFRDIPIVEIANLNKAECNKTLSESLIFMSFSEKEGFGLPPAEAMATGSIVIGYTGIGGNEYFTPETGFVIEDGDVFAFARTLKKVITNYRKDPSALDRLRQHASRTIWERYDADKARNIARETWGQIDQEIRQSIS